MRKMIFAVALVGLAACGSKEETAVDTTVAAPADTAAAVTVPDSAVTSTPLDTVVAK